MGWCSEFGPHIKEGCDHSMIAGAKSCSCPECDAVCTGRFDGCPSVWAAGPREVQLLAYGAPRPSVGVLAPGAFPRGRQLPLKRARSRATGSDGNGTNGNGHGTNGNGHGTNGIGHGHGHATDGTTNGGGNGHDPTNGHTPELDPVQVQETLANGPVALHILLTELRIVQRRLDEVQATCVALANDEREHKATALQEAILKEFEALPNRIAAAMRAALQEQHRLILEDVRATVRQAAAQKRWPPT